MKSYIIYIIEAFLCSGLFLVLYRWLIVRKPNYGFCRKYLIVTMLLSAVIPMLNVPLYPQQTIYLKVPIMTMAIVQPTENQATETKTVDAAAAKSATAAPMAESRFTTEEIWLYSIAAIYIAVLAISIALILKGLLSVARLKRKAEITATPRYQLAVSDKVETPFSFWRTIFIRPDHSDLERSQILSHEASHVAHRHSIEKLAMAVLRSLFWFNPFVWIAERRLEEVQEWQADRDALADGYTLESYRLTIIKQLFGCNPELTSGATNSLTKIRFMKMKQKDYQGSKFLQTAATVVLSSALFLSFGCGQSAKARVDKETLNVFFIYDADSTKKVKEFRQLFTDDSTTFEIYRNTVDDSPTEARPSGLIAASGVKVVKSPDAKELDWMDEKSPIYIDGKKSTLADFKALKPNDYKNIYYCKDMLVYVAKDESLIYRLIYKQHNTVTIDNGFSYGDLVSTCGYVMEPNLFIYHTHQYSVAAPNAKFAVDGKFVSYETFRQQYIDANIRNNESGILVYKAFEAEKRFGEVCEVVEFRTSGFVHISYFQNNEVPIASEIKGTPASGLRINYARKTSDYKEIAATIAKAKAANKQKGLSTIVDIDGYISDSVYNELLVKCIDTGDADITLVYNSVDHPATVKEEFGLDDDD